MFYRSSTGRLERRSCPQNATDECRAAREVLRCCDRLAGPAHGGRFVPAIRQHMSAATSPRPTAPELFGYRKYWAHRLTPAPFLPMSREEMDELGWDQCDVILVTGDAYVDHPSFGMAIVGRVLESQGFRVGII